MLTQVPIGDFIICGELRFQRKAVECHPLAAQKTLEHETVFERQQTMRLMRSRLLYVRFQAQWTCKNVSAEACVSDVQLSLEVHQQQHVAARTDRIAGHSVPQDASRQAGGRKSQRL